MEDLRFAVLALVQEKSVTIEDLWMHYFAKGGDADSLGFEAYIYGLLDLAERDALILSWVIDELAGR